jgi:replication-associated recombination protein RarA
MLFMDEVHRFNKAQQVCSCLELERLSSNYDQDIFLPYVEQGHIQVCEMD